MRSELGLVVLAILSVKLECRNGFDRGRKRPVSAPLLFFDIAAGRGPQAPLCQKRIPREPA